MSTHSRSYGWRPPHHQWSSAYAPESEPLTTLTELDALEDGAPVTIYWSGGNGPHQYRILHRDGYTYAFTQDEMDRGPRLEWKDPISFVGSEPPRTVIWAGWVTEHKGK